MKSWRIAVLLLSILSANVAAQNTPDGRWRAVLANNTVFNEVILTLKAEGPKLTGTADIGHTALVRWPGVAPIADGRIDGNRFSFTWTGTWDETSTNRSPQTRFTGTIDGDRMTLIMIVGDSKLEMKGERLPK